MASNRVEQFKGKYIFRLVIAISLISLYACALRSSNIKIVEDFDVKRYLGTWFEIARLEHRFETGLENITATYSLIDDASIRVVNKGYDIEERTWQTAEGTAKFVAERHIGRLKVSFFWPFYSSYDIIALDRKEYSYAMVTSGTDMSYLWILSRKPQLPEHTLFNLLRQAKNLGFATEKLIYVNHKRVKDYAER